LNICQKIIGFFHRAPFGRTGIPTIDKKNISYLYYGSKEQRKIPTRKLHS
jgi:hypothetical protein